MLLHQDAIPDAEGHTRRAGGLADDDRHDRHRQQTRQPDHPGQRRGGLRGIVARPGIESRCIDEGDDRQLEVTGQAQHPLRLAEGARSRRLTTLAGDERRRDAADAAQPGDHRRIVIPGAVAVQLDPLRDQPGQVIASARPLGMTGKPGLLPPGNPAPRRDRLPGGERGSGERSVAGCRRPVLAPVGEERDQNRQRFAQAGAIDNAVEHAARQQLFRRPGGLPARVPATGSDPGSWLGQDDVRLVRQRRPGRARRRVRQHADERHPGAVETRRGGGDLGRLDQPQQPLLGAGAAGGAEGDERETAGSGGLHGEEDLLARDRADAGAEEGVVEHDDHRLAPADRSRAGQHRLADATAGTAEPLRRLSEAIGHRQQVAEDEGIERHESGVRLPEALLIDQ